MNFVYLLMAILWAAAVHDFVLIFRSFSQVTLQISWFFLSSAMYTHVVRELLL
jgi:hypothetical protein